MIQTRAVVTRVSEFDGNTDEVEGLVCLEGSFAVPEIEGSEPSSVDPIVVVWQAPKRARVKVGQSYAIDLTLQPQNVGLLIPNVR